MIQIPFSEVDENDEFWGGAIFRKIGTGLNNISKNEDYYEYMIVLDSGVDYMMCVHIDKWEAGTSVCHLSKTSGLNRHTITAREFSRKMILPEELNSWFYISGGNRETRSRS